MSHMDKKINKDSNTLSKKTKKELDNMNVELSNEIGLSKGSKKTKKTYN
jgi:hypothetical protein